MSKNEWHCREHIGPIHSPISEDTKVNEGLNVVGANDDDLEFWIFSQASEFLCHDDEPEGKTGGHPKEGLPKRRVLVHAGEKRIDQQRQGEAKW